MHPNSLDHEKVSDSIKLLSKGYKPAIFLIALIGIVSFIVTWWLISEGKLTSHIVNFAGEQRLMSQRIAKNALLLNSNITEEEYTSFQNKIDSDVRLMKLRHQALRYGNDSLQIPNFGKSDSLSKNFQKLDKIIFDFHVIAQKISQIPFSEKRLLNENLPELLVAESIFLPLMNAITYQIDSEATEHNYKTRNIELVMGIIALITIIGLGFLIFKPISDKIIELAREIQKKSNNLNEANYSLGEKNMALQTAIEELQTMEEEMRAQNEYLFEAKEQYQLIANNMLDLVALHQTDGKFIYLSPSVTKILGYEVDELIGTDPYELFHPDDKLKVRVESHDQNLKGLDVLSVIYRIITKAGHYIWFETKTRPIKDEMGNVVQLQALSRDITDFKNLEIKLQNTVENLRAIFNASTRISIISVNTNGLITTFNSGAESMLGYTEAEMVNKQSPIIFHDIDEVIKHGEELSQELGYEVTGFETFTAYAKKGRYEEKEWTYIKKNGERLTVNLVVTAIRNYEGSIIGFLGMAMDVTELKKTNHALSAMNKQKDKLFSLIAHDLRGPINNLASVLDIVTNDYKAFSEDELFDLFGMLRKNVAQSSELLEELLIWSKSQFQKVSYEPEIVFIKEETNVILTQLSFNIKTKKVNINNHIREEIKAYVDVNMFKTIMRNLVSNAIKFSYEGSAIDIWAHPDGKFIQISVQDYGVGIAEKALTEIFNTTSNITTRGTKGEKGSGLGLDLCLEFVDRNGGKIWVESKPDKGSIFHFTIPCMP